MTRIAAIAGAAGLILAAAVPASAVSRDDNVHLAERAVITADVPAALNAFKNATDYNFSVQSNPGNHAYLCGMPAADPDDDWISIQFETKKVLQSRASFWGKGSTGVNTFWFRSSAAAKKAFTGLTKNVKSCTGTTKQTWTSDDGSATEQTRTLSNGVLKSVTVGGVASVFVHSDTESAYTVPDKDGGTDNWDNYDVYTLAGDAIINTTISSGSSENLAKRATDGAGELAKRAAALWLK